MTYSGYGRYGGSRLDSVWYLIIINSIVFTFTLLIRWINADYFDYNILPLTALVPGKILSQPWTLLTYMFVQIVGERKFFFTYLTGGIIGGLFSVLSAYTLGPSSRFIPIIGASGAVYALGGALSVLRPNARVIIFPLPIPIPLWLAVVIGLLLIVPNVAWQAHLGGALLGVLAGISFKNQREL
jgi:membrane associated rhomboid family serine protease